MAKKKPSSVGECNLQPMTGDTSIDLARLCEMHPRLPIDMAAVMVARAALGLQQNKHAPGTNLQTDIESTKLCYILAWPLGNLRTAKQHDFKRITEDGAEAIALAVAHNTKAWRVIRRIQQEEHADWLMEHQDSVKRKLVAFEVSGVDKGSIEKRLREKLAQVAKSVDVDQRCAGVVGFEQPEATLKSVEARTHGH
ncbi:MAG: hypothetical protein NTX50_22030 [Candidatus Sumerlaeota bacterium]|nr:hypothetical protein [Candidatus Sumerlaeota bacterium]